MRDVELLIPASNLEVLKVAVLYGADAVYIGGEMYGLRAKAKNFSMEDVKEGIEFAHKHGVKVYITANIVAHNEDLEGILTAISVHRQTVPTMRHTSSGMIRERAVSYLQENYLWKRSKISVLISQMIWKSNHLFMVLCVSLILEDAC